MTDLAEALGTRDPRARSDHIVTTLADAFSDLMTANPAAFRSKFRKMAVDPFAFYRGSAPLFYTDVVRLHDPWADERTSRVWIHGDLHAENFGTYMDGDGVLVFDVNDFDEAYLGHFTWDLRRLVASVALVGRGKAFSDTDVDVLVRTYLGAYLDAVHRFADGSAAEETALRRDNTTGAVLDALKRCRRNSRERLLDELTEIDGDDRVFRRGSGIRRLDDAERDTVLAAYRRYLDTIPPRKRLPDAAYRVVDVVGRSGFGIGSAGLPAYNLLIEGVNEALDNDVVLSMKQAVRAAPSRAVPEAAAGDYFRHHGHRTATSQRALQAHADRLLGHTELDGQGYVVSELSPYVTDLDWSDLTEPDDIVPVLHHLGWATARAHCVSDADSDQSLVPFQTEAALLDVIGGRDDAFVDELATFARDYAAIVREDHRLFVDAFRNDRMPGVTSTRSAATSDR